MTRNLVIIDDDPIYRLLVDRLVRKVNSSVVVHQCEDGKKGLATLYDQLKSTTECIILLDLNIPELDGWDILKDLRASYAYNNPNFKLYIVSSSTDQEDIEKVKDYDFVHGFYHKPLFASDIEMILGTNEVVSD